jgi:hypothetical protein
MSKVTYKPIWSWVLSYLAQRGISLVTWSLTDKFSLTSRWLGFVALKGFLMISLERKGGILRAMESNF